MISTRTSSKGRWTKRVETSGRGPPTDVEPARVSRHSRPPYDHDSAAPAPSNRTTLTQGAPMHLPSRHSRPTGEIPSSSMADIAFLLLVFFLVSTVFPRDQGLALVLPELESEQPVAPENILQIRVPPDGPVDVRRGSDSREQRIPTRDLERLWRVESAANPALIAAVQTTPDAAYHRMVAVLDALKSAGASRISLQMSQGDGSN